MCHTQMSAGSICRPCDRLTSAFLFKCRLVDRTTPLIHSSKAQSEELKNCPVKIMLFSSQKTLMHTMQVSKIVQG